MKRLLWLVGPPAAGKSTAVSMLKDQPRSPRILELAQWLQPLMDPAKRRKGVMRAKGLLIQAIRAVELEPENDGLPMLIVISAVQDEAELFPLRSEEAVLLLLPPRERWEHQFRSRAQADASGARPMDLEQATGWYEHYLGWVRMGLPVTWVTSSEAARVFIQELP